MALMQEYVLPSLAYTVEEKFDIVQMERLPHVYGILD